MVRSNPQPDTYHIWTQLRNVPDGAVIQFTDDNGKVTSGTKYMVFDEINLPGVDGLTIWAKPPSHLYRWVRSAQDGSAIHTIQDFRKVLWLVEPHQLTINLDTEPS